MSRRNRVSKRPAQGPARSPKSIQGYNLNPSIAAAQKAQELAAKYQQQINNIEPYLDMMPTRGEQLITLEDIKERYSLPVTNGAPEEERERLNMAFDHAGGFDMIYNSLQGHTAALGQTPLTMFLGYGMLQQISQNGMVRACVQTIADDLTRKWIKIDSAEEDALKIVERLDTLQSSKYTLQKTFHDAIALVGYTGGAFIFVDTGAEDEDLMLPLRFNAESAELVNNKHMRFVVVDPVNVTPCEYNCTNPLKSDYMKPRSWWVLGQKVHHSRLIPLVEQEPPTLLKPSYNFLGIPRAQILWDYVIHWNDCRIKTADLLRKISLLVVKTNTDEIFSIANGVKIFDLKMAALQRYRDNNSVYVCDKDREDVLNVQTSIAGATDIVRQSLEMIAAINRTPAVKLLGISPSGFNATGESDLKNYYDHVRSQQELYRDAIMRCLKAIQLANFGKIYPGITFEFNELASDNAASVAMTASTKANTWGALLGANVISPDEARQAVKNDPDIGLNFLEGDAPEADPSEYGDEDMQAAGGENSGLAALLQQQQQQAAAPNQPPADDASKYAINIGG